MQFTIRAKLKDPSFDLILDQMGEHLGRARRKFFVKYGVLGERLSDLKRDFIAQEKITARQFNSIASEVKALLASYKDRKKDLMLRTQKKIKKLKEKIKKTKSPSKIHQFKRQLTDCTFKLKRSKEELRCPAICFGSKKLFQKQFHLKENGYRSLEEWKKDWKAARDSGFFLIGSKDESFGNQSCQLMPGNLKLRLTHAIAQKEGREWIQIPVEFTYQKDRLTHALSTQQALNYRFVKNENGFWYVHLTFEIQQEHCVSDSNYGALGIDLNPSCIAVTEIDFYGNHKSSWQISTQLRGKSSEQIQAILGDEVARLVSFAKEKKIPIIVEELDFESKKQQLRSRGMNRMLSQFSYSLFNTLITARCFREGVTLIHVNPAYTSVIGKVKFSYGYGLSTHMGAAMAIARRGLGFGERLRAKTKDRLRLPVRNRQKHGWSDWRQLNSRGFPEEYVIREVRQRPERVQSEQSSSPTHFDGLARTHQGFESEVIVH